ncbi:ABC transporter permease [Methyloferula stellata]|uniref:ABC transporter permease n=1 Tax=Methyloferula stellata TaxID=876270 RepID=UPI0003822CCB|nr:FtsX-like permease family protein [Methyloferula stellata]
MTDIAEEKLVPSRLPASSLPLALRIAVRELRGGLGGFAIFLACIALGVMAITGVGSLSRSLADGLARQGHIILGGDLSFDLIQREASDAERQFFLSHGQYAPVALLRAMARTGAGDFTLVEIKAVDPTYPVAGAVDLDPPQDLHQSFEDKDGAFGIAADPALFTKLNLKVGDRLKIGNQSFQLRAMLIAEPDKLAAGIGYGPRVLMSEKALRATGLIQPGSLVRWLNRLTLGTAEHPASDAALDHVIDEAKAAFPDAGWEIRTRTKVSVQFSRNLDQFTQFLTLVGLTALIIGGVGVANAIRAFVARKQASIATMKALGATGSHVFGLMLLQVMLIAAFGTAIGAALGASLPFLAQALFGQLLPFPLAPALYPTEIATGCLYGLLTALAFSLAPLGHAHDVPVSALFRDRIDPDPHRLRLRYLLMTGAAALLLAATILILSQDRRLALIYMGVTLAGFLLLRGVAFLLMAITRRLPRSRHVILQLAIANIHRPGALTPSIVLSLGLGLALLVTLTLIDGNIRHQLHEAKPGETPSFYFLDIPSAEAGRFETFLQGLAPQAKTTFMPMMRGRIVKVKGIPAEQVKPKDNAAWALQGDRGITFSETVPQGSELTAGAWWPVGYAGPPLVSVETEVADGIGLTVGDDITVNVLGRAVTARVANLRKVNWRSFGMNFVLVFSPNAFAGAPHSDLATLAFPDGGHESTEKSLLRDTTNAFPTVTTIRVKEALDAVNDLVTRLAVAVRSASAIAVSASILVLAGALAAGQQARLYDAVVLKVLGATRARLLAAFLAEFGFLGLCTAIFGILAGAGAAYAIVTQVMHLDFVWLWPQALLAAFGAILVTIVLGLLSTWRILGRSPAPYLREL